MYEKAQMRPDIMNVIKVVPLNNFLHTHLYPCRYTYNKPNVPFRSFFYNIFYLFIPVFLSCYFFAWLIKRLKPERNFLSGNTTQVACIIAGIFLQHRTPADHQPP